MNLNKLLLCYIMLITMILSMEQPKEYLTEKALENMEDEMILSSEEPSEEQDLEAVHKMIRIYQNNFNNPDVLQQLKPFATDRLIEMYVHHYDERQKIIGPYKDHTYEFRIRFDGLTVMIVRNGNVDESETFDIDTFLKFPVFTLKISNIEKFDWELQFSKQFSNFGYDGKKEEVNIVKEKDIQYHFYVEDLFPELPKQVKNLQDEDRKKKKELDRMLNGLEDDKQYNVPKYDDEQNIHDDDHEPKVLEYKNADIKINPSITGPEDDKQYNVQKCDDEQYNVQKNHPKNKKSPRMNVFRKIKKLFQKKKLKN